MQYLPLTPRSTPPALLQWQSQLQAVFDEAPVGMILMALDGTVLRANRAVQSLLGIPGEAPSFQFGEFVHPDDAAVASVHYWLLATGDMRGYRAEVRLQRTNGTELEALISASAVYDSTGCPEFLIVHLQDVTEQRAMEDRFRHRALHDPLTGLPNRTHFADNLDTAITEARRRSETVAILLVDLDGFKKVNDTFGHEAGDLVLREVGTRLTGTLRDDDLAARFGGDEFALMVQRAHVPTCADSVSSRVLAALRAPIPLGLRDVTVTASIGLTYSRPGELNVDELLREADQALYAAKRAGRAQHVIFRREIDQNTQETDRSLKAPTPLFAFAGEL